MYVYICLFIYLFSLISLTFVFWFTPLSMYIYLYLCLYVSISVFSLLSVVYWLSSFSIYLSVSIYQFIYVPILLFIKTEVHVFYESSLLTPLITSSSLSRLFSFFAPFLLNSSTVLSFSSVSLHHGLSRLLFGSSSSLPSPRLSCFGYSVLSCDLPSSASLWVVHYLHIFTSFPLFIIFGYLVSLSSITIQDICVSFWSLLHLFSFWLLVLDFSYRWR